MYEHTTGVATAARSRLRPENDMNGYADDLAAGRDSREKPATSQAGHEPKEVGTMPAQHDEEGRRLKEFP